MREFLDEINSIYNQKNNVHKLDRVINDVKVVLYVYDSMLANLRHRGKYILMKGFKVDISEITYIPDIINKEKYDTLVLSRFLYDYEKEIVDFANVIEKNFSKDELSMFYKNIKTLKMRIVDYMKDKGQYDPYINQVDIKKEKYFETLPHELFHVATSRTNINDSVCGFHYLSKGISIGVALNEGYTEIMANRYFNSDISYSAYVRAIQYYDVLEDLIGAKKIEKLYMRADLASLIKELGIYAPEKEIINFIAKTDDILRNEKELKNNKMDITDVAMLHNITNKIIDVNFFLASLYFKKHNMNDLTSLKKDGYSELYKVNNGSFKNIYMESLTLYNMKNKSRTEVNYKLKQFYEIIGYDKLENICFKSGISSIINELIKYTSLEEIYKFLEILDNYCNPFLPFSDEIYDKLEEFNFSLLVTKSGILDDVCASVNSGFNQSDLFRSYRIIIENCIRQNKDNIFGDNDYFDYSDIGRLYELVGKNDMLRFYINGDIAGFTNKLMKYESIDEIMRRINSENADLREFLDNIFKEYNVSGKAM